MNSRIKHATAPAGRNSAGVSSNAKTKLPSVSSSHCGRGHFSCQSHVGSSSPCSQRVSQSNFSSGSCSGGFAGGSDGRRMSSGSYSGSSSPFGYGDGLVEVGRGIVGKVIGGTGGEPGTSRVVFSSVDGKTIMQNLNDRLAGYMENMRRLEAENAELETKIEDFIAQNGPIGEPQDFSHYYRQIEEFKKQLICAAVENSKILLKTDNHQMNAEDMKQKLWTEYGLRQNVEADINGLHPILDQLTNCKYRLEVEFATLQQEMYNLKKTHEEKLKSLEKMISEIDVKVHSCPEPDLKKILEEMRCQYEAMINSNLKEVTKWYELKLQEVCTSCQEVENGKQKVIDLRCQMQGLETDLQTQCNLRDTMQASLAETEGCYSAQLDEIQGQILCTEQQLAELHLEMEDQSEEYKELLDVKNRLEQEIKTYRHLLEGGQQDHVGGRGIGVTHPSSAGSTRGKRAPPVPAKRQSSPSPHRY